MSVTHDLQTSLARARQWVRDGERDREVTISVVCDRVRCCLAEYMHTAGGARRIAGGADGGEHYDDPAAEQAHAIDAALERATEARRLATTPTRSTAPRWRRWGRARPERAPAAEPPSRSATS